MSGNGHNVLADQQMTSLIRRSRIMGVVAGVCVVLGAIIGGNGFVSHLPGAWFFGTPGGPLGVLSSATKFPPVGAMVLVYGGMGALVLLWIHLARVLFARPGIALSVVIKTVVLWSIPFLIAPPLFSRDVYSYVGQGALVALHINPYHYGTGVLGATSSSYLAGTLWASTPSPYGPTFLGLAGLITGVMHTQVLATLIGMRLLAVIGLALVAWGVPHIARQHGVDPGAAVMLAVGSPLALGTLIGGAHNDGLMVGLLIGGLVLYQRGHPVWALIVLGVAAGVKAPAILGVVLVGWNWPGVTASLLSRMKRAVLGIAIATAALSCVSAIAGVGFGWVRALGANAKVYTGVTPIQIVARLFGDLCHLFSVSVSLPTLRSEFGVIGLTLAVVIGAVLLWRSPSHDPLRSLGIALCVLALLSPVLWAWYVSWGVVVLAPVATGWLRRFVVALVGVESLLGVGSVLSSARGLISAGALPSVLGFLGVAAALLLAQLWLRDAERSVGVEAISNVLGRDFRATQRRLRSPRVADTTHASVSG